MISLLNCEIFIEARYLLFTYLGIRKDAFRMACVCTGRDFARRLCNARRELRDREGVIRTGRGTSRHVAVALYTNSIMHARANINYCGFNIGRRRWQ